jgi:hypothetical protein
MGVSGQLYLLPSGAEPTAIDVDLRDGLDMGNTSATTSAGKVVGDTGSITEPIDIELYGLKLIAGNPIISWPSILADLKGLETSKTRYGNF